MKIFYKEYFKIVSFISFSIIINVSQLVSAPLHEAILAGDMVKINKLLMKVITVLVKFREI